MVFSQFGTLHKVFIVLYSLLIIIGFYFDYKEKTKQDERIKEKINKEIKSEIFIEVDEDERYMLHNLAYLNGYNSIEGFMSNILKENLE